MTSRISRKKLTLEELAISKKYKELIEKQGAVINGDLTSLVSSNAEGNQNPDLNIYTEAEILMEQIVTGAMSIGTLTLDQKVKLFYFIEKYNKRAGRICDIQTRIPLTTMRLQKPQTPYAIVNEYVYNVFDKMFRNFEFKKMMEEVVRHYWLFGFCSVLIEDDFEFLSDTTNIFKSSSSEYNIKKINDTRKEKITKEERDEAERIDGVFAKAPDSISVEQRVQALRVLINRHSPDYKGIKKVTVLSPFKTLERSSNKDIDYHMYLIDLSPNLIETIRNTADFSGEDEDYFNATITTLGYSQAMLHAVVNDDEDSTNHNSFTPMFNTTRSTNPGDNTGKVAVDNDPYNNQGMYVVSIQRNGLSDLDNSQFNRVLDDIIDLHVARRRLREKVQKGFKKITLVTVGEIEDEDKMRELQENLTAAAQEPEGSIVVTNLQANLQDADLDVKEQLDLSEIVENANQNIVEGLGIPNSLIVDSTDAYSNSFLKTTVLENEWVSFRETITDFVEKKILEPLAIKMGFVTSDEWGEPIAVYPKLKFNKLSLARSGDEFQQLIDLCDAGKISMDAIYESLGLDKEVEMNKIIKEQRSVLNPALKEGLSTAIVDTYAVKIAEADNTRKEIEENNDLPPGTLKVDPSDSNNDSNY